MLIERAQSIAREDRDVSGVGKENKDGSGIAREAAMTVEISYEWCVRELEDCWNVD